MSPVVRSQGEEQKVLEETEWGGLNPLRGPSAALTAPPECNAPARSPQEKRRAMAVDDKDMALVTRRRFSDAWENADVELTLADYWRWASADGRWVPARTWCPASAGPSPYRASSFATTPPSCTSTHCPFTSTTIAPTGVLPFLPEIR